MSDLNTQQELRCPCCQRGERYRAYEDSVPEKEITVANGIRVQIIDGTPKETVYYSDDNTDSSDDSCYSDSDSDSSCAYCSSDESTDETDGKRKKAYQKQDDKRTRTKAIVDKPNTRTSYTSTFTTYELCTCHQLLLSEVHDSQNPGRSRLREFTAACLQIGNETYPLSLDEEPSDTGIANDKNFLTRLDKMQDDKCTQLHLDKLADRRAVLSETFDKSQHYDPLQDTRLCQKNCPDRVVFKQMGYNLSALVAKAYNARTIPFFDNFLKVVHKNELQDVHKYMEQD